MTRRYAPDVLKEMVQHVCYEFDRLHACTRLAVQLYEQQGRLPAVQILIREAMLEAALLHLRNATDFLVPPTSFQSDHLLARDYFDGDWSAEPVALLGATIDIHLSERAELNKRPLHLTVRLRDDLDWVHHLKRVPLVLVAFDSFIEDLRRPHPERAAWFDRHRSRSGSGDVPPGPTDSP